MCLINMISPLTHFIASLIIRHGFKEARDQLSNIFPAAVEFYRSDCAVNPSRSNSRDTESTYYVDLELSLEDEASVHNSFACFVADKYWLDRLDGRDAGVRRSSRRNGWYDDGFRDAISFLCNCRIRFACSLTHRSRNVIRSPWSFHSNKMVPLIRKMSFNVYTLAILLSSGDFYDFRSLRSKNWA